ncbi:MAG TPA: M1 family metallopeptidase [Vicinamibacteria bacterium]|nr:M1 family metallopeptidase [Vicinamibacteria bacterium]
MLAALALSAALQAVPAGRALTPPQLRLPAGVRPLRQSVDLALDPDALPYTGTVEIELELTAPTPVVWLNAQELEIRTATLGTAPARVVAGGDDFVGMVPEHPLAPGRALLRLSFAGTVSRQRDEGLFAMKEGGEWYLFTQFEAVSARRVFPCFDEPAYKIPWQVTLRVPRGRGAFSNTPLVATAAEDGRDVVRFAPTRPLPSYLVAFAVGPFDTVDLGAVGRGQTPARLVVPKGRAGDATWARETTSRIVELLEQYFDRPYPYEKLDQLAIPGVDFAMEHPGLVTYGMGLVVQREREQTLDTRREWVSVAAHELAHQWFGDLVTMAWWDDTWLNESFASWMGEKVTDRFRPEWGTALRRVAARAEALEADSLSTARRIRQPIAAKQDIEDAFDGITYGKGEAVLEMLESWLGEETFRRGVQSYLDRHAWGNATTADFASQLSAAAGRDVSAVLSAFLDQTGAPVVAAEARCDGTPRLRLRQRAYHALGSKAEAKSWPLPVCVHVAASRQEPFCTLLGGPEGELPLGGGSCPAWSYANAGGAGYYRTLLAPGEARRALGPDGLSPAERIALASELFSLVASFDLRAGDVLGLVEPLAQDREARVVRASVELVSQLERLVDDGRLPRYRAFVRTLFGPAARRMGGFVPRPGEAEDDMLLRRALLTAAAGLGRDPELERQATRLARRWLDDPGAVDPDMVETVLSIGAGSGDRALVERLRSEAVGEEDRERRERLLQALGSVRDPALARDVLALTLDPRIDARESIELPSRLSGSRETRRLAFDYLVANREAITARLPKGMLSPTAYLPLMAAGLCTARERREVAELFAPPPVAAATSPRVLAQALERIDQCVAAREAQQPSLAAFLDGR